MRDGRGNPATSGHSSFFPALIKRLAFLLLPLLHFLKDPPCISSLNHLDFSTQNPPRGFPIRPRRLVDFSLSSLRQIVFAAPASLITMCAQKRVLCTLSFSPGAFALPPPFLDISVNAHSLILHDRLEGPPPFRPRHTSVWRPQGLSPTEVRADTALS